MNKTLICALPLAALCAFGACKPKEAAPAPAPLVEAVKALKTDVPWQLEFPAQVAGTSNVDVRAQVGGILKQKYFEEGALVTEGQPLFLIDPEPYEIALKKAKGTLAQADSDIKKTKRDYDRMKALFKENAVSRKDHDDSLSAYEKAQANFQVAQGTVDDAQRQLNYTKVLSPSSGITRNNNYSVGNLVAATGEGSFLVNIVQIDPLEVDFSIPSSQWQALLKSFRAGQITPSAKPGEVIFEVQVIMPDGSFYPHAGKMKYLDAVEDTKTGTIFTYADVPNPDKKRLMMPGQFVKVLLKGLIYKDAVVLPQNAVLSTAKGSMVYVVGADNIAKLHPVKVTNYKQFALVEGLEGGETVISQGVIKVKPDAPVQLQMAELDISALAPAEAAAV